MEQLLCTVFDLVAGEMITGIQLFKSETVAQRAWADYCRLPDGNIRPQLRDQILVCLGTLNSDTLEIKQDRRTVMTGAQWLAIQENQ